MPGNLQTVLLLILFAVLSASHGFRHQMEYCSLLDKCEIPYPASECPDSLKAGLKGVEYDSAKCLEARQLHEDGVASDTYLGQKLYGFLGQKYRVDYQIVSTLPIKVARFEYLLNDIPLAAKVVNAMRKTEYTAMYLDGDRKKYWRGNNGKNLQGEANLIAGGIPEKQLIYFGFGIVKILKWKLKGQVLMDYKYFVKAGEPMNYDLKVVVFPGGAVVNAIMNMGMFKKVVQSKIIEVFTDIVESANELEKLTPDEVLKKYKWTEEDVIKLKELMSL